VTTTSSPGSKKRWHVKSNINLKKLIHNKKYVSLKNYIPTYNNSVKLKDHTIELIFNKNLLNKNGLIILHRRKTTKEKLPNYFEMVDERTYGISKIIFGKFLS